MSILLVDRLREHIAWIDQSLVERDQTPRWVIQLGIYCHLENVLLHGIHTLLERSEIELSHVNVNNWINDTNLHPVSAVSEDQLAADDADYLSIVLADNGHRLLDNLS